MRYPKIFSISSPIRKFAQAILVLMPAMLEPLSLSAQEMQQLDRNSVCEVMTLVGDRQTPWDRVQLSGKLKSDPLPISPTLKVYMENSNRIDISIRAPFLGEVGRLQADRDTIVVVNKMKKTYWSASMAELSDKFPGGLELIQSVLLGRMMIFGEGVAGPDMGSQLTVYPDGEDGWLIMPKTKFQPKGARYGYVAGPEGETEALIVEREGSDDYLQVDYDWKKSFKYDLLLQAAFGNKNLEATMSFDTPNWDPLPMAPIAVDSKYRRVEMREFLSKIF